MSEDIDSRLLQVFSQVLGPAVAEEVRAKPSRGHPAWDSIAHINLVMAVEQEFGTSFTPVEAGMTMSFQALKETLTMKLG